MSDHVPRLRDAITVLVERFKLQPDGPYEGLGLAESSILLRIAATNEQPIQGAVGLALGLPKTTMASAIRRLEDKGLVIRTVSEGDARVRCLALTTTGTDVADRLLAAQLNASRTMLEAIPVGERDRFVRILEGIVECEQVGKG